MYACGGRVRLWVRGCKFLCTYALIREREGEREGGEVGGVGHQSKVDEGTRAVLVTRVRGAETTSC